MPFDSRVLEILQIDHTQELRMSPNPLDLKWKLPVLFVCFLWVEGRTWICPSFVSLYGKCPGETGSQVQVLELSPHISWGSPETISVLSHWGEYGKHIMNQNFEIQKSSQTWPCFYLSRDRWINMELKRTPEQGWSRVQELNTEVMARLKSSWWSKHET